jgi:hypothetical protein
MRAGSVKAYAVSSDVRLASAPDIPTFREMGLPALPYTTWAGFFAPKGTPKDIINKLNAAAVEAQLPRKVAVPDRGQAGFLCDASGQLPRPLRGRSRSIRWAMSGSTGCGHGSNCGNDVMGHKPPPALQKDQETIVQRPDMR